MQSANTEKMMTAEFFKNETSIPILSINEAINGLNTAAPTNPGIIIFKTNGNPNDKNPFIFN